MTQVAWLGEIAWKGTVILVASFAAAALISRASAAARHFLWTVALGALLLLPLAISVSPQWKVQPPMRTVVAGPGPATPTYRTVLAVKPKPVKPSVSLWLGFWMLGCALAAMRFAIGAARIRWILRRSKPAVYAQLQAEQIGSVLRIRRRVTVVESADAMVPLACGILRPAIVLPRDAGAWREARLRTVLWHELAHTRRYDLEVQTLGQAACCLYWFHPLAWIAARRLRLALRRWRSCCQWLL